MGIRRAESLIRLISPSRLPQSRAPQSARNAPVYFVLGKRCGRGCQGNGGWPRGLVLVARGGARSARQWRAMAGGESGVGVLRGESITLLFLFFVD